MQRYRMSIDSTSYIESFNNPSIQNIVIFVHGIFGSAKETWKSTPTQLMTSPVFAAFDYGSYGYGSQYIELRDPDLFVDQLVLWLKTNTSRYENVFVIAHSMGGLLVRHAIVRMLRKKDGHPIARKIRQCFMVASPVSGSRAAKALAWIPGLGVINRRIPYLANPTIDGRDMSLAYKEAAAEYVSIEGDSENIPHFHFFVGIGDSIVSPPERSFYTEFDHYEGPIEGTHATLKIDLDANSVLIRRITQLIQDTLSRSEEGQRARILMVQGANIRREQAIQEKRKQPLAVVGKAKNGFIDVVLLSCSATKTDAGERPYAAGLGIVDQVSDDRLAGLVLNMRSRVARLVQEGKLDGIEFAQGNRSAMPVNQKLVFGPDLGGGDDQKLGYLPAYARYRGRSYRADVAEWETLLARPKHPRFLIMSGLYGLIPPTEHIQNYDVHLTDVDMSRGVSLQSYWKDRELMTQILISHLEWIEKNEGPVGLVIDALSELSYQETINWSMVDSRWNVFHRVFERNAGRHALGNLGIWIQDVIRTPEVLRGIEKDHFYENGRFHPTDRIAFESRIGESELSVGREVAPWDFDLFLSHASEDKDTIARPLYEALVAQGLSVWFDEAALELGDSLRRKIDQGLALCHYGVVILSPTFLRKEWPQRELDGLVARETASGEKAILPVWHGLNRDELVRYSPTLADRLAGRSEDGIPALAKSIASAVRK